MKGDKTPLGARLFMVADVYDALTSQRPYRSPITCEEATAEIVGDGGHFDPSVLEAFIAIAPEELRQIADRYQ